MKVIVLTSIKTTQPNSDRGFFWWTKNVAVGQYHQECIMPIKLIDLILSVIKALQMAALYRFERSSPFVKLKKQM